LLVVSAYFFWYSFCLFYLYTVDKGQNLLKRGLRTEKAHRAHDLLQEVHVEAVLQNNPKNKTSVTKLVES
jgi:hypothetical protein